MSPPQPMTNGSQASSRPRWSTVLRALREARGVTLDGWGARLGVSRTTVQRWERGERAPDPGAEMAILNFCREAGLFRVYDRGPLAGINLTVEMLQDLFAEARWRANALPADPRPPSSQTVAAEPDHAPQLPLHLPPSSLPVQLTSFIGREQEIATVRRIQAGTRLLTLTGSGGCGKTRLALALADELLWAYPNGVWFVELASLADHALIPQAVASTLAIHSTGTRPVEEALTEALRSRHLLLLLDNCEHLLPDAAALIETLLRACPHLAVVATSRSSLGIAGETVWRVPPMAVPVFRSLAPDDGPLEPDTGHRALEAADAVRLFVERARLQRPEFDLAADAAVAVVDICRQLDGMPLAIELAAARVSVLSVSQIAARLHDRFRLLTGGGRTALPRHQTLRATIDWSHDLLSPAEQALLHALAVFAGSFTLEAAEAICGNQTPDLLDRLAGLVDHSLVIADEHSGEVRYRLLETVRQYAEEQLVVSGEATATRDRHLAWYLALTHEANCEFQGPDEPDWLIRLDMEHDNLRSALAWSLSRGEDEPALRLAGALPRFWELRGHMGEGRQWLARVLTMAEGAATAPRAAALNGAAILAQMQGDFPTARALAQESLVVSQQVSDRQGIADATWSLGYVALRGGDLETARASLEESLSLHTQLGCTRGIAGAHGALGVLVLRLGDYDAARRHFESSLALHRQIGDKDGIAAALVDLASVAGEGDTEASQAALLEESLAIYREIDNRQGIAMALGNLGTSAWFAGDHDRAASLLAESLALYRQVDDRRGIARLVSTQGLVALSQRDFLRAAALCREGLTLFRDAQDPWSIARYLPVLAGALFGQRQVERSARLYAAGVAMRDRLGASLPPTVQPTHDRAVAAVRASLGDAAFAAAWTAGQSLTPDQAVAEALQNSACSPR